jgi:hypothetical protein
MSQDEFKFPDEIPEVQISDSGNDVEVEIVDDTPPADRNRAPLPQNIVEELEKDDLKEYSEGVQQRIKQMKKVWHDERREKERLAREKEEAMEFARQAYADNKRLRERLGTGEKIFISEVTKAANTEVDVARGSLEKAYESGDPKAIAQAQELLMDAKDKLREYQKFKPTPLQEPDFTVQAQQRIQQTQQAVRDDKAETWRERNSWFGPDREMTALALGTHEKLVNAGYDPTSDAYYRQIDLTMRKRFPERFEDEDSQTTGQEKPAPRKSPTVVAPATRSTAPRQVRLSSSEAATARALGITPEAYAREKMKLENSNG